MSKGGAAVSESYVEVEADDLARLGSSRSRRDDSGSDNDELVLEERLQQRKKKPASARASIAIGVAGAKKKTKKGALEIVKEQTKAKPQKQQQSKAKSKVDEIIAPSAKESSPKKKKKSQSPYSTGGILTQKQKQYLQQCHEDEKVVKRANLLQQQGHCCVRVLEVSPSVLQWCRQKDGCIMAPVKPSPQVVRVFRGDD